MRESERERESGRSTGETAKCPLVRRVSDLGHTANTGAHGKTSVRRVSRIWAHDKLFFLFLILNQSIEKNTAKHHFAVFQGYGTRQRSTLLCAVSLAHGKPSFFSFKFGNMFH